MEHKELLNDLIDAVINEDDDAFDTAFKDVVVPKTKTILEFTDDSSVQIKGDDVFVKGKKVGEVKIDYDDDDRGILFVGKDGRSKYFDTVQDIYSYISQQFNIKESDVSRTRFVNALNYRGTAAKDRVERIDKVHSRPADKDGKEGEYKKHDVRKDHKDSRMDKPKKHDHGHDDPTGLKQLVKEKEGNLPPDKEHDVRKDHKDSKMDTPSKHDHGHDDPSGTKQKSKGKEGPLPPDKEHDVRKNHKDSRMDKPKKHDHGHDDPSGYKEDK